MLNKLINSPFLWQSKAENLLPFKIDIDDNLYFFDLKVKRLPNDLLKPEYQEYVPDLAEIARSYVMDQRTAEMVYRILHAFIHNREPVILQGDTATSKTTAAIIAAGLLGLPVIRMNYSNQTSRGDLVGRVIPNYSNSSAEALKGDFVFKHGVVPRAILNHCMLLNDEFNLAPLPVRTIFNSIMDNDPLLFIPETGEYLKKEALDPEQRVSEYFFSVSTQNKETYGARNKIGGDLQSRARMCPEVSLPVVGELVEMLQFYITGIHPQIGYNNIKYQAKKIMDPLLKNFQKLGGAEITELISVVAQFHFMVQSELEKTRTGEAGLNARRQQVQVVSRRNIMNLFQILEKYEAYDPQTNKIYNFFERPAEVLSLAIDLVYTNQFILDPNDQKIILKIKKDIFNKTKMPKLSQLGKNNPLREAENPFLADLADKAGVEYLLIHDQKIAKRTRLSETERHLVPHPHYHSLDQETAELYRNIAVAVNTNKAVLLEGPPAKAKTTSIETIAARIGQPLIRLGLDGQVGVADFLGRWMPGFTKLTEPNCKRFFELTEEIEKDGVLTCKGRDVSFLSERSREIYQRAMEEGRALNKEELRRIIAIEGWHVNERTWSWIDGPLPLALEKGYWLIWDEVNHVDIGILDRFLPLLEDKPYLYIAENNGKSYSNDGRAGTIKIDPNFRLFATMNPAEYIGKNALSPAFINRWPIFLQRKETDRQEISGVIRYLVYGIQPDVILDNIKYSGKKEEPFLKNLSQLIDAPRDDLQKKKNEIDMLRDGLWGSIAELFDLLAGAINPLRLSAEDKERILAVDNDTMQITIRLVRRFLECLNTEKIYDTHAAEFENGRPVYTEKTVLTSNADLRDILWKDLELIVLDLFNDEDQAKIIPHIIHLGLSPDNWKFSKVTARRSDAENIRILVKKYTPELAIDLTIKPTTSKEQAENLYAAAKDMKKKFQETIDDFHKEVAIYGIAESAELKALDKEFTRLAAELEKKCYQYANDIARHQINIVKGLNEQMLEEKEKGKKK